MAKKRLELTPPKEGASEPEARYQRGERRLELVNQGGDKHAQFSHEGGSLTVDQKSLVEFRKREDATLADRAARKRNFYEREEQKLQEVFHHNTPAAQAKERFAPLEAAGKIMLSVLVVYFGLKGAFQVLQLAFGAAAPEAWSYLGMALLAATVLAFLLVPPSLARPLARMGYAIVLFYFGISGLMHLYRLFRHPPARGVDWGYFGTSIFSLVVGFFVWRGMKRAFAVRAELFRCRELEQHPYFERYPNLRNPSHLRAAIYATEALLCVGALLMLTSVFSVIYPASWAIYGYVFVVFVAFRATFYPLD